MTHPSRISMFAAFVAVAALLFAGCTDADEGAEGAQEESEQEGVTEPADEDEPDADEGPDCRRDGLESQPLIELTIPDPVELADQVAARTHACAPVVVVAVADDPWIASLAVAIAHAEDAPLLLATADAPQALAGTLARLATEELVTVGLPLAGFELPGTEVLVRADATSPDPDADAETDAGEPDPDADADPGSDAADLPSGDLERVRLAVRVAEHLGTERFVAVEIDDTEARAAALRDLGEDLALLPLPADDLEAAIAELPVGARLTVAAGPGADERTSAERLLDQGVDAEAAGTDLWPADGATAWLADPDDGAATAVAAVAAAGRDEVLLPVHSADLRSDRDRTTRLRAAGIERSILLGAMTTDADWQLATVLEGQPFPWGGFRLFEDERMVALYGSVETSVLGALGEQDLDATLERLRTVSEPYGADGARVLPAFEMITTIASAAIGPTGDYSRRTPIDTLRPWIDRAAEEDIYVFLDLQPGRTDFLTQAKEYEELLRLPHVGLALDPEWRLGPDQVHLRQIGSVSAAEVQEVADWLAALTREERLPEKLLVLHQFRFSMLPDREDIVAPPELAVVVHMDGQGPIGTKYDTYGAITRGFEDRWLWGWKNFYDEDTPTPTPAEVLDLSPLPVLVTYQ